MTSTGWQYSEDYKQYIRYDASLQCWLGKDNEPISQPQAQAQAQPRSFSHENPQSLPVQHNVEPTADPVYTITTGMETLSTNDHENQNDDGNANEVANAYKPFVQGNITALQQKQLDPDYQTRNHKFFQPGKVIKALWPEPMGTPGKNVTATSDANYPNEKYHTKPRLFVIVVSHREFCCCVPISSYSDNGVAKYGVEKGHHAIIFTGKDAPDPTKDELPIKGEDGMLKPIRVKPSSSRHRLSKMSRINFAKIYSIDKYVKVLDFGEVHPNHLQRLLSQFSTVFNQKLQNNITSPPSAHTAAESGGYGSMTTSYGTATSGYGTANSGYNTATTGYGAPTGYSATPAGYGVPPTGYGATTTGYSNATTGYSAASTGYGNTGYGGTPAGHSATATGYAATPTGYTTNPAGYSAATSTGYTATPTGNNTSYGVYGATGTAEAAQYTQENDEENNTPATYRVRHPSFYGPKPGS